MDKQLDVCFDRVEKALGTLVDSIAKYHPSTNQVHELGAADIELNKGLEDLQTHQSNYRRIQDLRAATAAFDGQIKDTLQLLANTRKELVNTSATVFPDGPSYDIKYDELLSYARRISKTTMPPAGATNGTPSDSQPKAENGTTETAATTPGETPNGTQSQPTGEIPASAIQQALEPASQQTATSSGTTLPEHLNAHLNPNLGLEFIPWPNEEQVRKGAIASIAYIAEQGIDPENYDPAEEKARKEREEEERQQEKERERLKQEADMQKRREEEQRRHAARQKAAAENAQRGSISTGGNPPSASPTGEKKQFQFSTLDDDDDDDED
ncbi:hypothetical protein F5B20DRAFT_416717 [Whalleya microplaca]|nr:hypothetical protein F5B20DRAFT_416717 [Whalleya microplaca]